MRSVHIVFLASTIVGCSVASPTDEAEGEVETESSEAALSRTEDSGRTLWAKPLPAGSMAVSTDRGGDAYVFSYDPALQRPTINKFDPYGRLLWKKELPLFFSASNRAPGFTSLDGEIYVTGTTPAGEWIDLGCGSSITGTFVAQLTTDGDCAWQYEFDARYLALTAATVDAWGRATIAGFYNDGTEDPILYQFDRAGRMLWARSYRFDGGAMINALATDGSNRLHLAGVVGSTIDFGGGPLNALAQGTVHEGTGFVVTLEHDGAFVRQRAFGTKVSELQIGAGADGRVVVGGRFLGTLSFDDKTMSNGTSSRDLFLARFDSSGDTRWTKKLWGSATMKLVSVGFDPWDYVDAVGRFSASSSSTRTINVGPYDFTTTSSEMFAAHFTPSSGATVWARSFGSTGSLAPEAAVITPNNGRILATGWFTGTVDFGKGPMTSDYGGFLVRLHP